MEVTVEQLVSIIGAKEVELALVRAELARAREVLEQVTNGGTIEQLASEPATKRSSFTKEGEEG